MGAVSLVPRPARLPPRQHDRGPFGGDPVGSAEKQHARERRGIRAAQHRGKSPGETRGVGQARNLELRSRAFRLRLRRRGEVAFTEPAGSGHREAHLCRSGPTPLAHRHRQPSHRGRRPHARAHLQAPRRPTRDGRRESHQKRLAAPFDQESHLLRARAPQGPRLFRPARSHRLHRNMGAGQRRRGQRAAPGPLPSARR